MDLLRGERKRVNSISERRFKMSKTEYTLKQYYDMVCNLYVLEFLRKHEFWDEEGNTPFYNSWVGDEIGGILYVSDYYIGFNDIKLDIDKDVDKDVFLEYYWYTVDNEKNINYRSYLKGMR